MNNQKPCDFLSQTLLLVGRHTPPTQKGLAAPSYEPTSSDVPHPSFHPFICPLVIWSGGNFKQRLCSGPSRAVDQAGGTMKEL